MRFAVGLLLAAGCGRLDFGGEPLSYPDTVLADRPFAYYRLDETKDDTVAADSSGNHNDRPYLSTLDGVVEPAVAGALMPPNDPSTAVHFAGNGNESNGSVGYVDLRNQEDGAEWTALFKKSWTVEMFLQMKEVPTDRAFSLLVCEDYDGDGDSGPQIGSGFRIGVVDESALQVWNNEASGDTVLRSDSVGMDAWHHFVVVHHDAVVSIYIDGVDRSPADNRFPDYVEPHGDFECGFGAFHGMPSRLFLDEVALYDKALDATAIAEHYAASGR